MQRLSAGLGEAVRSMILNGLHLGAGRAIWPLRETLHDLLPRTEGETPQDVPAGGPSVLVERAPDNVSSNSVQISSIARRRLFDTCTDGGVIGEAHQVGMGLPRPARGRARNDCLREAGPRDIAACHPTGGRAEA